MKTAYSLAISLSLGLTLIACSGKSGFNGGNKSASLPAKTVQAADVKPAPKVIVTLDQNEVRSGGKTIQATAAVTNAKSKAVTWSVSGPAGIDVGTIDASGLYTSPASLLATIDITIAATLGEDKSVSGSAPAKVIPADQIFVGCQSGTSIFPIVADVYKLPVDTRNLPDFSTIPDAKSTTVCMDGFNVPTRDFNDGFPGVPDLYEWFGLHATGKLILPSDGLYAFRLISDDGSIFSIDGSVVVNNDGQHSAKPVDGMVQLKAGPHDLVVDYFQGPANQIALQLLWKTPADTDFSVIPPSAFVP